MKSWLEKARDASGLSPEDCASAMKCSRATYMSRENAPGKLNLDEIRCILGILTDRGKEIVWQALCEFKP